MDERAWSEGWSDECPCGRVHGEPSPRRLQVCADCDRIHTASDVVAIGRFNPDGPNGYRTPDGEIHPTREAGQKWLCEQRQVRTPSGQAGDPT